jgi:phosphohistidine phosphatase
VIWLLRHGDAADGSPDAERPLTSEGERQGENTGRALAALGVTVEACLTSPKLRAAETARRACEALGIEPIEDDRLSGGPIAPNDLTAGFEHVLLVGHDPDLSTAVHELTGAQVRLPKGGLAGVDRGELSVLLRPPELAAIAG